MTYNRYIVGANAIFLLSFFDLNFIIQDLTIYIFILYLYLNHISYINIKILDFENKVYPYVYLLDHKFIINIKDILDKYDNFYKFESKKN